MDSDLLFAISKALRFDFFTYYSKWLAESESPNGVVRPKVKFDRK